MDQKRDSFFTVILMPRGVRGKYTTLALSKKNIQIILTVSGVMLFLLLFVLVDYASVKRKAFFAKKYEVENKSQAQKIALLEGGMKDLQGQLQRFENYKRKLNIIAGLESPMALKEVGSGGSSINPTGLGVTIPRNTLAPAVSPKEVSVPGKISSLKSKAAGIEKNLDFLYKFFREQEKTLASSPSIWPTKDHHLQLQLAQRPLHGEQGVPCGDRHRHADRKPGHRLRRRSGHPIDLQKRLRQLYSRPS